ncbi:MAG: hypothetical protein ACE5K1_09320 [Acidiferrobacterales bacterium]
MLFRAGKLNRALTLTIVFVCLIVGVLVALSGRWADPVTNRLTKVVAAIGGAYAVQYAASRATPVGASEYLIVLASDAKATSYVTFFEQHPDIEYLSESIYPNTLRVALKIPVRDVLADLNAQPFVNFVVRNYPFLFCH